MLEIFKALGCRVGVAATVILLMVGVSGCSEEVDQTEANVQGAWRAAFGDVIVWFNLYPDNTYSVDLEEGETAGTQSYTLSDFGKIPPLGQWRLGDGELVFSAGGRTVGGLEVASLEEDQILLKANDGTTMYFQRKTLNGTSAFGTAGDWDDEDTEELDEMEDPDATTTEPAD